MSRGQQVSLKEKKRAAQKLVTLPEKGIPGGRPGKVRLWLFRLMASLVAPLLLLGLAELGFRIFGVGYPVAPVLKSEYAGKNYYHDNRCFAWRFFPPAISREFEPFIFPAEKDPGVCRIFVVGSSAAQGVPDPAFSFSRHLGVMLRVRYPGVHFEVINAAMTAINSHVVREIVDGCARLKPDLFIVYMGNNEVVGPYGAGTLFSPISGNLGLIRAGMWFKATRWGQLLSKLSGALGLKEEPTSWKGLELFMKKRVPHDDPRLEMVYRHFSANLQAMISRVRASGTPAVVCTTAVNLKDCPPFASLNKSGMQDKEKKKWEELFRQGIDSEDSGNYSTAVVHYLEAEQVDEAYADLHYRLGRCYWEMGDFDGAKLRYLRALELDVLRFRADRRINEIIRDAVSSAAASGASVRLCDAELIFRLNSEHGVPGERFFYEHVHFTFNGNYLLARAVLQETEPLLPLSVKEKRAEIPVPGGAEIASTLAYTPWDRFSALEDILNNYLRKPPHTNQSYHPERIQRLEEQLNQLSAALAPESLRESAAMYRLALEANPNDPWLCKKYARLNGLFLLDYDEAGKYYRRLSELLPHSGEGLEGLGYVLREKGDYDGAISVLQQALPLRRYKPDMYNSLAVAFQKKGDSEKAEENFRRAFAVNPSYTAAYSNLALILKEKQRFDEAVSVCQLGVELNPDSWWLHHFTGMLFMEKGLKTEAEKWLLKAVERDPSSEETRNALAALQTSTATGGVKAR